MNTEKRLTNAYKEAKIEYFDKNSKYIIFSDTHRAMIVYPTNSPVIKLFSPCLKLL